MRKEMNIIVIYSLSGQVSGLDKHQLSSDRPLKYAHIDIAPSAGKSSFHPRYHQRISVF